MTTETVNATVPDVSRPEALSLPAQVWALFRRNLREGLRSPVIAFLFPVIFPLFAITLVAATYERISLLPGFPVHPYAAYMAPGMLLLTGMMGSGYSATALILDAQTGFLDRLRLQPIRATAVLMSRLLFDAARVVPAVAIVLIVSLSLGARLDHGVLGALLLVLLCSAWSVAYGGLFYAVALRTGNPQAPLAMSPLFILLMFTSPAAAPTSLMPGWLESVSQWNPFTYMVAGARACMTGPVHLATVLEAVGVLAGTALVTQLVVVPGFLRLTDG
ncbi:MAG: ABC transporter permease [Streptomyces sp.]|nr:ABC transporter permease [Streptomyces sp.]